MVDPLTGVAPPSGAEALDPARNPFRPTFGHVPPHFGGRYELLANARTALERVSLGRSGRITILEGLRGTGKTSAMARIARAYEERDHATVHLELSEDADRGAVADTLRRDGERIGGSGRTLRRIAQRLQALQIAGTGIQLRPATAKDTSLLSEIVVDLGRIAAARDRALLLTLDEVHESPALGAALVRGLHRTGQLDLPVVSYLAGLPGLRSALAAVVTYAERAPLAVLGLLDDNDVATALRTPFLEEGIQIDEEVLDRVVPQTAGYPYFIAVWGYQLWNSAPEDRIDLAAHDAAAPQVRAETDRFYAARNERMTPAQRRYASALAAVGPETARSAAVAEQLETSPKSVSPARAELIAKGIVHAPDHGEIAFTVPGFGNWLASRS